MPRLDGIETLRLGPSVLGGRRPVDRARLYRLSEVTPEPRDLAGADVFDWSQWWGATVVDIGDQVRLYMNPKEATRDAHNLVGIRRYAPSGKLVRIY